jgi:hypothetical protein
LDLRGRKQQEAEKIYMARDFIVVLVAKYFHDDEVEEDEMDV